jgi:CRP-like cAMP-binding protein
LDEESLAKLVDVVESRSFPAGWIFQQPGNPVRQIGLVTLGLFKTQVHTLQGNTHILGFSPEGTLIVDYPALVTGRASQLQIESLEPGHLLLLRSEDFSALLAQLPALGEIVRKIQERHIVHQASREISARETDASEKIRNFEATAPPYRDRLLGKDIAALLGMTPMTFSRMRRRI